MSKEFPVNICKEVSPSSSVEELKTFVSRVTIYAKHRKIKDEDALASVVLFFNHEIAEWFDKQNFKRWNDFLKKFSTTFIHDESKSSYEHNLNNFRFTLHGNIPNQIRKFWKQINSVMTQKLSEVTIATFFRIHVIKNMKLRIHIEDADNQGKLIKSLTEYAQQHPTNRSVYSSRFQKTKSFRKNFVTIKKERMNNARRNSFESKKNNNRANKNNKTNRFKQKTFIKKEKNQRQSTNSVSSYPKKEWSAQRRVRSVLTYNY